MNTLQKVIKGLQRVADIFQGSALAMEKDHASWGKKDVRITAFGKCRNATYSTLIGLACLHHHLRDPQWWKMKTGKPMDDSGI